MSNKEKKCVEAMICCKKLLHPANIAQAFTSLILRLFLANLFWRSGMLKIQDWDKTLFLFQYEYDVNVIPAAAAAIIATSIELACPIALLFGFGTRIASAIMLFMILVMHFVYSFSVIDYYLAMLFLALLSYGPGMISCDHLIRKAYIHKRCSTHEHVPARAKGKTKKA